IEDTYCCCKVPSRDGGRGKSDPLVANSSDENRAKNRRVTLKLVSEITEAVALDTGGELTEFDAGPCGAGEEGSEIGSEESVPHYRYTASTREVGEHLVVDLKATVLDDVVDSAFGIGGYSRGVGGAWRLTPARHRDKAYEEGAERCSAPSSYATLCLNDHPWFFLRIPVMIAVPAPSIRSAARP